MNIPVTTIKKPWGMFACFTNNESSTVKLLYVDKGGELSLQYHEHREEFWKVIRGNPEITIGEQVHQAKEGSEFFVPVKEKHRISAKTEDVIILEISTGHFDEDDIVRLEDRYNRLK